MPFARGQLPRLSQAGLEGFEAEDVARRSLIRARFGAGSSDLSNPFDGSYAEAGVIQQKVDPADVKFLQAAMADMQASIPFEAVHPADRKFLPDLGRAQIKLGNEGSQAKSISPAILRALNDDALGVTREDLREVDSESVDTDVMNLKFYLGRRETQAAGALDAGLDPADIKFLLR